MPQRPRPDFQVPHAAPQLEKMMQRDAPRNPLFLTFEITENNSEKTIGMKKTFRQRVEKARKDLKEGVKRCSKIQKSAQTEFIFSSLSLSTLCRCVSPGEYGESLRHSTDSRSPKNSTFASSRSYTLKGIFLQYRSPRWTIFIANSHFCHGENELIGGYRIERVRRRLRPKSHLRSLSGFNFAVCLNSRSCKYSNSTNLYSNEGF